MISSFIITLIIANIAVYILICLEKHIKALFSLKQTSNESLKYLLLEPFLDAAKLFSNPNCKISDKKEFLLSAAAVIAFCPVLTAFCLIPFSASFMQTNFDTGIILFLALVSIPAIGGFLAGFSGNNAFSLQAAARAILKSIISIIPMAVSILAVTYLSGSLNINEIIQAQSSFRGLFGWYFLPLFIGAIIFFISMVMFLANNNFDTLTLKSAFAADYTTERPGIKLALFEISRYLFLFLLCLIFIILFFGGYLSPFGRYILPENFQNFEQIFWLLFKTFIAVFCIILTHTILPKARSHKLLELSYKVLLPLSLINLNAAILILYFMGN